jgi:AraC-like DNA-binding protein
MADSTVSAGLARGLLEFAVSRGGDPGALLARSGIARDELEDHDTRIPFASYLALMRAGKELCNDPALALHFAEAVDMSELSVVGLLTLASPTMMDAFAQLNRYGQLVVEVDLGATPRFALEQRDGALWAVDRRRDDGCPELTESTFARMTCNPRRFLSRPFVLELHVTHAEPAHRAAYERIFQCPVVFGSHWNAMRIDPQLPFIKIAVQPRYVFGILSAHADALLQQLESSKSARGRVERTLMPILHTGTASMDLVAQQLGLSRQRLYRDLKAEGVTFEQVLDELRHQLALHYLGSKKVSVNETAYLVGFSDPAAFSRAFKRWTGTSPRAARMAGADREK